MSTCMHARDEQPPSPLRVRSVVGLAYDEMRAMIVDGTARARRADRPGASSPTRSGSRAAPSARRCGGSRATGSSTFEVNRGFFVANFGLEGVLDRLEARLLLEPAGRPPRGRPPRRRRPRGAPAGDRDERAARRPAAPTTRAVRSTRRSSRRRGTRRSRGIFDGLWIADVGRRLLASRRSPARLAGGTTWPSTRSSSRRSRRGDGDRAETLMRAHVESAWRHWSGRSGED